MSETKTFQEILTGAKVIKVENNNGRIKIEFDNGYVLMVKEGKLISLTGLRNHLKERNNSK